MKKNKSIGLIVIALLIGGFAGFLISKRMSSQQQVAESVQQKEVAKEEIWTCSMHHQIRQNSPGTCPICGMDLIPLEALSSSTNPYTFEMTEGAIQLANIQTTVIGGTSKNTSEIELNGKVKADETQAASLVTHIPGRIEKLYVSFTGESVYKGQKIATLYSPDLITAQKELIEAKKIEDISPGLLIAAKNKLKFWKLSEATIEAIIASEQIRETFDIYADHSGVVMNRNVSVGDYITTGEVLFNIQNLNKLWILFDVYEKELSSIKLGNVIEFSTASEPSKIYKAKITFIDPVIHPATRVATIRAEVLNSNNALKPEMFVKGTLKGNVSGSQSITIPKSAVMWTGTRSVVYVKVPDTDIPSFEFREIDLGKSLGKVYMVQSGLSVGEEVVTNGAFVIDAAAQLNNQASMMNRNVRATKQGQNSKMPDYRLATPEAFKVQLGNLTDQYILLKDALVDASTEQINVQTKEFLKKLLEVDMEAVKGEVHLYWMEQMEVMSANAQKIIQLKDIEQQRNQFEFLSMALIRSIKALGMSDHVFYIQHCPMANENNGGDWISLDTIIRNPYFGDKMLTCGFIQDTIVGFK